MKNKKILSILIVLVITFFAFPIGNVKAASYPLVIINTYCGSVGETVPITLYYRPAYNYEELDVVIYDNKGKTIGTVSEQFNNAYSSSVKYYTVNWNTAGCSAGVYTIEVTKKFYSFYSWHETPTKTTGTLELYDDLNDEMPKNDYSGIDSYFTCVQDGVQNGMANDVSTSFTAWRKVSANYQAKKEENVIPYTIQLQEMYIGEEANTIVTKENQYNLSADSTRQWILMKYQITNNGTSEIKASNIITNRMFYKYTGNKMTVCETASFSGDRDNLGTYEVTIPAGETKETWIGILVPITQGMPFLKVQNGYGSYCYLNANPDKTTLPIVTELPTATPKPTNSPQPTITTKPNVTTTTKPTKTVAPTATPVVTQKKTSVATSFSSLSAKKNTLTLKWKKKSVTGYEIQYSTNAKFKGAKKIVIKSRNITKKKISKLAKNKKYYLRIRTYTKVKTNGKTTTLYSSWSKTKAKKTKK